MHPWFPLCLLLLLPSSLPAQTALSPKEQAGGWSLLLDGKTSAGWLALGGKPFPANGWTIGDGVLLRSSPGGGDLVTAEEYDDFEFAWEWRLAPGGNSGVKYNLVDSTKPIGCEYQLVDDVGNQDAGKAGGLRQTGALYDVIAPSSPGKTRPPGEWNRSRIVVQGAKVEHWLNDAQVVAFELGSEALRARVLESKFKGVAGWGEKRRSPILLQDHGDEVAFRNLKLRRLK